MLYFGDFVLRYYVWFLQIRSHMLQIVSTVILLAIILVDDKEKFSCYAVENQQDKCGACTGHCHWSYN